MGRIAALIVGLVLLLPQAQAQNVLKFGTSPTPIPYITGPVDPGIQQANLNSLIQELNLVLSPVLPTSTAATSGISGVTNVTVGPPAGTTGNVGVLLNPSLTGNIQLFTQFDTGVLQIGSQAAWYPVNGLQTCPGTPTGRAGPNQNTAIGPGALITGYFEVLDWVGRQHFLVTC